jgi:hypothetical protein
MKDWHYYESYQKRPTQTYRVFALICLIVGSLSVIFTLIVWLGAYKNVSAEFYSLAVDIKGYTWLTLFVNDMSFLLGIASLRLEKKVISIIGLIICALVSFPLFSLLLDNIILKR